MEPQINKAEQPQTETADPTGISDEQIRNNTKRLLRNFLTSIELETEGLEGQAARGELNTETKEGFVSLLVETLETKSRKERGFILEAMLKAGEAEKARIDLANDLVEIFSAGTDIAGRHRGTHEKEIAKLAPEVKRLRRFIDASRQEEAQDE